MKPGSQTKVNIGVGVGFLMSLGGYVLVTEVPGLVLPGWVLALCGWLVFLAGCCLYADGKGHSSKWGMLGLFGIIGLIVLVMFSDRYKGGRSAREWDEEYEDDRPRRRRLVGESNLPWRESDADQSPPREERDDDDDGRRRASKPWDRGTR